MSLTALRWSAIPLGLLAFGLNMARTFWLTPLTWDLSPGQRLLALMAGLFVAIALPYTIFLLLARLAPVDKARFVTGGGGFVVPRNPTSLALLAIGWMYMSSLGVVVERVGGSDSLRLYDWRVSAVLVALTWFFALRILFIQKPRLHLDPEGFTLHHGWRTTRVAWDHVLPGNPAAPSKRDRFLYVYLRGAPVAGNWPKLDIPIRHLHINPTFLANALRHYGEHPEDRASIGKGDVPVTGQRV